jgi:hypothetical protein
MSQNSPKLDDVDRLLAFLPKLGAGDLQIYADDPIEESPDDGVLRMYSRRYSDDVQGLLDASRAPAWRDADYGQKKADEILSDPKRIAVASLQDIKTLLTFCVRSERFAEGSWGSRVRSGEISAVLNRLAELKSAMK